MRITITDSDADDEFIYVRRTIEDWPDRDPVVLGIEKMPAWTHVARAAEYDLDPADPIVMDMVLLENFHTVATGEHDDVHPLFAEESVAKALSVMRSRLVTVRKFVKAPTKAPHTRLWTAADTDEASAGLVTLKRITVDRTKVHAAMASHVQAARDHQRGIMAQKRSLSPADRAIRRFAVGR